MSNQIDTASVKQYSANIFHLSQQRGSRLRSVVRNEMQNSEVKFFERLGATEAVKKINRHGDTPLINSLHSRRGVFMSDYEWADLIDDQDKIRTLNDPENPYVQSAYMALGRSMDDDIIEAALGDAVSGKEGDAVVSLPASQYVGSIVAADTALSTLNTETLIRVKSKFGKNDVDPSIPLHIACSQEEIDGLLFDEKLTNADYANVKALVNGEVDSFMGFKFHRLERLDDGGLFTIDTTTGAVTLSSGNGDASRKCFAWAQDGIILSTGMDIKGKISERDDKSYSTQVYAAMSCGAVRVEEEKVVGILTKKA